MARGARYANAMADPKHHVHDEKRARVSILTVSDTRTRADDLGGDEVVRLVLAAAHVVATRSIVPDDAGQIRQALTWLASEEVDAIITTGGTGIAARDVTYEVVAALLEKRLDGFGEAFRRLSWEQIGARAILSRAIAGTLGSTLIFALPGSPRAVQLAMESIVMPVLGHAVGLLR